MHGRAVPWIVLLAWFATNVAALVDPGLQRLRKDRVIGSVRRVERRRALVWSSGEESHVLSDLEGVVRRLRDRAAVDGAAGDRGLPRVAFLVRGDQNRHVAIAQHLLYPIQVLEVPIETIGRRPVRDALRDLGADEALWWEPSEGWRTTITTPSGAGPDVEGGG